MTDRDTPTEVTTGRSGHVIGACFALAAFAVAIIAGLSGGNDAARVLARALVALVACYPVGLICGLVCQRVVREEAAIAAPAGDGAAVAAEAETEEVIEV